MPNTDIMPPPVHGEYAVYPTPRPQSRAEPNYAFVLVIIGVCFSITTGLCLGLVAGIRWIAPLVEAF